MNDSLTDYLQAQVEHEVARLHRVARLASDVGMDATAIEAFAELLESHACRHAQPEVDLPGVPVRFGWVPGAEC